MKKSNCILTLTAFLIAAASLHAQTLTVDKPQLTFSAPVGTTPAASQTVTVSSAVSTFFVAQTTELQSIPFAWLKISNPSNPTFQTGLTGMTGQSTGVIAVEADPTNLQPGTYTGTIMFNNVALVSVTFNVGSIGVSPGALSFAYQSGSTLPAAQQVTLTGTGQFTALPGTQNGGSWLTVSPTNATLPATNTLIVGLDPNITPTLAAGTYNGQITITPIGGANNTPASVAVTLTVTGAPTATVSPSAINLYYQINGANNTTSQTLTIATNSAQPVVFGVSPSSNVNGRNWILANPTSGSICQSAGAGCTPPANGTAQVSIGYDTTANLSPGTYTGVVTLFTPNVVPAQQNVQVNLLVSSSPLLVVPSATLSFNYEVNGSFPAAQTVTATSTAVATSATTGQIPIIVAVTQGNSWLSVTPPTGIAPNALTTGMVLTVAVNPAGLTPGTYTGTISITGIGAGNPPQIIQVTLTVGNDPLIVTNTANAGLSFESQIGQSPVATSQTSQTVTVSSSSGATLNYTATAAATTGGSGWLVLSGGTSGATNGTFSVNVVPTGLAAGTYNGTVTIAATNPATGNAAINSPVSIPVTLYVSSNPLLVVTLPGNPPAPPSFTAAVNGAAPPQQTITVNSTSSTVISYNVTFSTASGGNSWLFAAPPTGGTTAPGQNLVTVLVNPGLLSAGTYTGAITITASGATVANSPITIPVTFTVTGGTIALNPTSLSFTQATSGTPPAAQAVQVTSSGQQLTYTAAASGISGTVSWLSVSPSTATGTTPGSISISVDGSKLSPGSYTGTVTVTAPNATPATLTVSLTVSPGTISATPTTLTFTQAVGGPAPPAQGISVTGTPGSISFAVGTSVTSGNGWLSAVAGATGTSQTGATPATVIVSANAGTGSSALAIGTYNGTVTITAPGATGSPITVPVVLNVVSPQTLSFTSATPLSFNYILGATQNPSAQTVSLTSSGTAQFTASATAANSGTWLSVTPASGTASTTPTNLSVSVNPTGLAAGSYTGTITVSSPSVVTPLTLQVTLNVSAVATPVLVAIKNSASYTTGAVAPGELVLIGGTNVGPATLTYGTVVASNNTLSTNVAGVQVFFDNTAAPIYYATATQTAVFVPYEVAGRPSTVVTVVSQGGTSNALTYSVVSAQPGIFTQNSQGSGPGSIVNPDGSVNGPNNGAAAGSVILVYMTGEGQTNPGGVTGAITPGNGSGLKMPIQTVTASIGGLVLTGNAIAYAGSAPNDVNGVMQVNLIVPAGLTPGPQPIVVTVGSVSSQSGVTVQTK